MLPRATILVDVTEQLQARFHDEGAREEVLAPEPARDWASIADAARRAMRDEHIDALGNERPLVGLCRCGSERSDRRQRGRSISRSVSVCRKSVRSVAQLSPRR